MDLFESNFSLYAGVKKGYSGFLKPDNYSQYINWVGGVTKQTTGYTLTDYADTLEDVLVSGDYKNIYKHYYYTDSAGSLKDRPTIDPTPERGDDEPPDQD